MNNNHNMLFLVLITMNEQIKSKKLPARICRGNTTLKTISPNDCFARTTNEQIKNEQ